MKTSAVTSSRKIFCDPVHGHISLHPVCVAIIDTPQFQRLRHIKQTGLLDYVFPGATHDRFGHSLGVCYLAGKFLQQLRERQPELAVTDVDILCVEIAGLCHDLGHGPLSHTWEDFMRNCNIQKGVKTVWKHEKVSENMFDNLIEQNGLVSELRKYGISDVQLKIIKQLIRGDHPEKNDKAFLYQIVNNDDSGLDVDKWDYFLRDCHYLGLPCSFQYERLMQFAKVLLVNGSKQICFRDKVLDGVYNMFRTRSTLHRLAYQHKVSKIIEVMMCDIFMKADGKVTGPSGEKLQFWEWSMAAAFGQGDLLTFALEKYCTLTDSYVLSCLRYCVNPELRGVVRLMTALEKRSCRCCGFYQHVLLKVAPFIPDKYTILDGMAKILPTVNQEVMQVFEKDLSNHKSEQLLPVLIDEIKIQIVSIHWGKKEKNPVEFVHFYSKDTPFVIHEVNHDESAVILPKAFEENQIHVICTRSDAFATQVVKLCFEEYWQSAYNIPSHF